MTTELWQFLCAPVLVALVVGGMTYWGMRRAEQFRIMHTERVTALAKIAGKLARVHKTTLSSSSAAFEGRVRDVVDYYELTRFYASRKLRGLLDKFTRDCPRSLPSDPVKKNKFEEEVRILRESVEGEIRPLVGVEDRMGRRWLTTIFCAVVCVAFLIFVWEAIRPYLFDQ